MQQFPQWQSEHFVDVVASLADLATEISILRWHSTPVDRLVLLCLTIIIHLAGCAGCGTLVLSWILRHDTLTAHVSFKLTQRLARLLFTFGFTAELRDLGTFDGRRDLKRR